MPQQPNVLLIIAAVVGAVGALAGILFYMFSIGRRVGQLETKLTEVDGKCLSQTEWGELKNKVDTLYKIYVLDALQRKPPTGRKGG